MTGAGREFDAALEPVRTALRTAAEETAAQLRTDAADHAAALLAAARAEAQSILASAAQEGRDAARAEAALRSARARRRARELVLAQRSSLRRELRRRAREAAAGLTADPRYPELRARLAGQCTALLGPDATVSESPEGGVIAVAGTRRLDLSLPVLAELALESMPDAGGQWTP